MKTTIALALTFFSVSCTDEAISGDFEYAFSERTGIAHHPIVGGERTAIESSAGSDPVALRALPELRHDERPSRLGGT